MNKLITNAVVALACLVLMVPAALVATGRLPLRIYVVRTGSMAPTIQPNSAVVVRAGVYKVGQAITFKTQDGLVTHRLVEQRPDGMLVTKGDANETADPGLTSPADVIGGVVASPPLLGRALVYLKNPVGLASIFLAIAVAWLLPSTVKPRAEIPAARTDVFRGPALVSEWKLNR